MEELKESKYFEELETALEAAGEAGSIIDDYYGGSHEAWNKEDGSVVTDADIEAQETIVETIRAEFPDDGFLGEEEHLTPDGEERTWIIDPVDGTFNFENGFPYFCVSIALEVDGELVMGVIGSPERSLGETFIGLKNHGAYILENGSTVEDASRLEVSEQSSLEDALFFHTFFDVYESELESEKEVAGDLAERGAVIRQLGSGALELALVGAGRVDFLVNPLNMKWDYAAGKIIVEEAGGDVRIRDSRFPGSHEVVASNGELQEEVEHVVGERYQ